MATSAVVSFEGGQQFTGKVKRVSHRQMVLILDRHPPHGGQGHVQVMPLKGQSDPEIRVQCQVSAVIVSGDRFEVQCKVTHWDSGDPTSLHR